MSTLVILGTSIRQDSLGRYCLNDLHRASGGATHHQPGKFFANKGTQELVAEIQGASPNSETPFATINDGVNNGTYVAKELVYAYAMWISAAFHLKVIRAYDSLIAQPIAFKIPQTMAEALRLAADQQEQIETQQLQIKRAAPKVELVDNFLYAGNGKTGEVVAKELAKEFDIGRNRMYAFLKAQGVFNDSGIPRQCHIDAGRFYLQPTTYKTEHGSHQSTSVRFTAKGEFHVRALLQKEGYAKRIAA